MENIIAIPTWFAKEEADEVEGLGARRKAVHFHLHWVGMSLVITSIFVSVLGTAVLLDARGIPVNEQSRRVMLRLSAEK